MRIAFVTPEFVTEPSFSGGLSNYLGRVSTALADCGHDVHVYTRSTENGDCTHRGVHVHRVLPVWDRRMILDHADPFVPRSLYFPYQYLKAAWCLARRVKRDHRANRFDVVQVANVMSVGFFLRKLFGTPVVVRMSSYRPECDEHSGNAATLSTRIRSKMEERSVRNRRYVYAPSEYVAKKVSDACRLKRVAVIETPYFVETEEHDRSRLMETVSGRRFALFFGTLSQLKGVHVLARAMTPWMDSCPEIELVLIGRDAGGVGCSSMKEFVRSCAGRHADRVHVLDALRHEQLYPFISEAEFVVLPSLVENLPNALLESMGHGKVVIGTTGSSFEQLVSDGISGFLVPPGDVSALAAAMIKATRLGSQDRHRIGRAAAQCIERLHPSRAVPKLVDYFESVRMDYLGVTESHSRTRIVVDNEARSLAPRPDLS
jgi:glycosyltransferase involved in cell wall biosynthesis